MSPPETEARELIFEVLRNLILIVMWIQPIFSFTELVTYRSLQSDADMLLNIFQIFSEQLFTRQLKPATVIHKLSYFDKQSLATKVFLKTSQSPQKNTRVGVSFLINLQASGLQPY